MSDSKDINIYMDTLGASSRKASRVLAQASAEQKNDALLSISKELDLKRQDILKENVKDLEEAKKKQRSCPFLSVLPREDLFLRVREGWHIPE